MAHAPVHQMEAYSASPHFIEHFEESVEPFAVLSPEGIPVRGNAAWRELFQTLGYVGNGFKLADVLRPVGGEDDWLDGSGRIRTSALCHVGEVVLKPTRNALCKDMRATLRLDVVKSGSEEGAILCSLQIHREPGSQLGAWQDALEAIGDSFDIHRIAGKTCQALRDLLKSEAITFYIQSPEPNTRESDCAQWDCIERLGRVDLMSEAPATLANETVEALTDSIVPEQWLADCPDSFQPSGRNRAYSVALRMQGDLLGLIILWGREVAHRADSQRDVLHALCFTATLAVEHARWFRLARFSESRSSQIVENANVLIVGMDPSGHLTLWNHKAADTLGSGPAEALGHSLSEVMGISAASRMLQAGLDAESPAREIETLLTDCYGIEHQVVWNVSRLESAEGQLFGLYAIGHDVTRRRQLAHQLAESEESYRHLVENTHDLYWIIHSPDLEAAESESDLGEKAENLVERLQIKFVNRAFGPMRPHELTGQPLTCIADYFSDPEELKVFLQACARVLTQGVAVRGVESGHIDKTRSDKAVRYFHSDFFPLRHQGKLIGLQILSIDISDKREMEAQMLQAQKLESIGTLSRGISHDFNNILNGINGFLYLIERQCEGREDALLNVNRVRELTSRAARLTRQMQAYARQGEPGKRAIDLNEIIRRTVDIITAGMASNQRIHIEADLQDDIEWIKGDVSQIEQVIMNLCTNALEAMPKGGSLSLRTHTSSIPCDADGKSTEKRYAVLEVRDTGVGMPPRVRDRIFDPFFSTKKTGSGLGLSAVYGILKSHNAPVRVESEPDVGSCFTIHFPATGKKQKALGEAKPESPTRGGYETVLVADDEESIRLVSADILRTLGYRVITAADGEEAVTIFQERPQSIDLVILDIDMPNLNGRAAARVMQLARPDMRVLFASGFSDANQRKALKDEGFHHFLSKPFTMHDLQSSVRAVLDHNHGEA